MKHILYFLISLTATGMGALTGMGGGVIIKPMLDALGGLPVADAGILSSATVFSMAIVSAGQQIRRSAEPSLKMAAPLAIGSLLGGGLGDRLLRAVMEGISSNRMVVVIQNICLSLIIIAVFLYMGKGDLRPACDARGVIPALLVGAFLGVISSFLGIGGGPANVALILFVFACNIKTAATCSIIIILFAQASKLTAAALSGELFSRDLTALPVMMAGAVMGGWIGSRFNRRLTDRAVEKAFAGVQALVLLICLFNIHRNLIP